ncbi:hypothetical protein FRB99_008004 [Tulasnella sp. 403]|nr:hypothetical protein FRB99_008004 [Tulasnella sp. 403]
MLKRKSSSTAADRSMPPPPSPASQSVTHTSAPMVNTFVELDSLIQQAYISPEVPSGDPVGFGFNTGSYAADAVSSGGVGGPVDPDMESLLNLWTSPSTAYLQPLPPTPSSAVLSSTSPQLYQASPYQDILQTPASLPPSLFGTSPDIVSASPSQPSPALRLFDDIDISTESTWSQLMSIIPTAADAVSAAASTSKSAQKTPAHIGLGLHTSMSRDQSWEPASSSSASLSVSPQSLSSRPLATSTSPPHVDSPQTESQRVTGVRKNIKPTDLIPFDAPIQPRNYITPSVTSRKEIPPSVARTFVPNSSRKRSSTSAGLPSAEEMHDELADEDPAAAAEALRRREMDPEKAALLEHVEAARRRNTLAARKSRQRKLEHVRNLEELVERLQRENEELQKHKEENEQLRKRVELLEAQVEQLGGVPARLA